MGNFKAGDRVVCVELDNDKDLIVGREYISYGLRKTNCCGQLIVDVGFKYSLGMDCNCGGEIVDGIQWFDATCFRKVEEKKEVNYVKLEIEIEEPCLN